MGALVMGGGVIRTPFFIPHTWCAGIAWRHRWYRLTIFTEKAIFTLALYAWGCFFTVKISTTNTPYGVLYFFVSVWQIFGKPSKT